MKMKFGKLLAAGKSWVGYPGAGRYQMREGLPAEIHFAEEPL
jgi:hypothetical protein